MPLRPSKNVVQKIVEFPPELAEEVEAFAESRGASFKSVVLRALRRHLDHPPPIVSDPPLPPGEPDHVARGKVPSTSRSKK